MNKHNVRNLLWTSGWDSTYRLVDLALVKQRKVQPYYIIDRVRPSTSIEIRRMDEIRELLHQKDPVAAERVLPTIYFERSLISENSEIVSALNALRGRSYLGKQYEF